MTAILGKGKGNIKGLTELNDKNIPKSGMNNDELLDLLILHIDDRQRLYVLVRCLIQCNSNVFEERFNSIVTPSNMHCML